MREITSQLESYQEQLDTLYPPITAAELESLERLEREGTPSTAPTPWIKAPLRLRALAFVAAFVAILGLGVFLYVLPSPDAVGPTDGGVPAVASTLSPVTTTQSPPIDTTLPTTTLPPSPMTTPPPTTAPLRPSGDLADLLEDTEQRRIAIGPEGRLAIAYWSLAEEALQLLLCADALCSEPGIATLSPSNSAIVVEGDRRPPFEIRDLMLRPGGAPTVLVADNLSESATIFSCADPTCRAVQTVEITDDAFLREARMAITPTGAARIAYLAGIPTQLKLAVCDDVVCDAASMTTLEIDGDPGPEAWDLAIRIDADGSVFIGYTAGTADSNEARVAVCSDDTCSAGPSLLSFAGAAAPQTTGDVADGFLVWYRTGPLIGLEGDFDAARILDNWRLMVVACDGSGCAQARLVEAGPGLLAAWRDDDASVLQSVDGSIAVAYSQWDSEVCAPSLTLAAVDPADGTIEPLLGRYVLGSDFSAVTHGDSVVMLLDGVARLVTHSFIEPGSIAPAAGDCPTP